METHLSVLMVQRKAEKKVGTNGALKAYSRPSVHTGLGLGPNLTWGWPTHAYRNRGYRWPAALLLRVNSTSHKHQGFWTRLTKWVVLGYITKGLYKLLNNYLNSQNKTWINDVGWHTSTWRFLVPGQGCMMTYYDLHSSSIKPSWTPSSIKNLYIYIYNI